MSMSDRPDLDLPTIRRALEDERADLLHESEATAEEQRPVELDQQTVGRLSRMDALQVQAMAQALEARRQGRLRRIEAALQRLDAGDFGFCEECGDEIPVKRLDIDPATERCVDCAH
jgi:DnaK suppressor protein